MSRRDVLTALEGLLGLIRSGITVVTLMDGQRYSVESVIDDSMKLMMSIVIMMRAHEESASKAHRVKKVWEAKRDRLAATGEALTGRCVAWCRKEGTGPAARAVLIPDRAAVILRIFELTANGYGHRQVARLLNREGIPDWGRGKGWQASYISKILGSRAVLGFFQPHRRTTNGPRRIPQGEEIKDYYPAAVSEALYFRAIAARAGRRGAGGRKAKRVGNLFSGIAKCAACGRSMLYKDKGKPPKGGQYLVCDGSDRELHCPAPSRWRYAAAEDAVLSGLHRLDVTKLLGAAEHPDETLALADLLANKLASEEKRRDRLIAALGDVEDAAVVARLRAAVDEVARLKAEHGAAIRSAGMAASTQVPLPSRLELIQSLRDAMDAAGEDERSDIRTRLVQELRRLLLRLRFTHDNILADYKTDGTRNRSVLNAWNEGIPLLIDDDRDRSGDGADAVEGLRRMASRRAAA